MAWLRSQEQTHIFADLLRWLVIGSCAGVLAGSASALLLASLTYVTEVRESHKWLIALLPVAGLAVGCLYKYLGKSVEAGNNLILDEIHDPKAVLPLRMTPLILIGTVVTHLFGGSAGREGTALQTGASLADQLTRMFGLHARDRRILLMAGLSAGFGSVFGVPLSGAIFGIEVLAIGRMGYDAIFPCFVGAFVGDFVCKGWGIHHTVYRVTAVPALGMGGLLCAIAAGIAFGLTGMVFAKTTHAISAWAKRIKWEPMRPVVGGVLVAAAVFAIGTTKYIGLGVPTIVASFAGRVEPWDWAAKLVFTAVTLGFAFKGGEVTPLFYIGATLGNALAWVLPLPPSLLAGMGFVAVFAGAANTPIASSLMAVELFGAEAGAYAAIACVVSYLFSGHAGIYNSQRVGRSKHARLAREEGLSLGHVAKVRIAAVMGRGSDFSLRRGSAMSELTVLRLYFSAAQLHKGETWWRRLTPQPLGHFLLQQAKEHGIEQALLHSVVGGFLKGQSLRLDAGEIPPRNLPQCLELVGEEGKLRSFLDVYAKELAAVRPVFLRGEEARVEAEVERQELEAMFGQKE